MTTLHRTAAAALTTALLTVGLSACGNNPAPTAPKPTQTSSTPETSVEGGTDSTPAPLYDKRQVVDWLNLHHEKGGSDLYYTMDKGGRTIECWVSDVFTSREAVDMYASAQSNVAATPEGNAGVEVSGDNQGTCYPELVDAMTQFEPAMAGDE
jgi:hypothetical protein